MGTEASRFEGTVFLDRDGTINRKPPDDDYVKTVEEFVLLPAAAEAIRTLNSARRRVIVVTNQRGIALGRMTEHDLEEIHEYMLEQLAAVKASVDAIYHCPHDRAACACRKPQVGMFRRAAAEYPDVTLRESAIFGDSGSDMLAGTKLGMTRVLIANEGEADGVDAATFHHRVPTLIDGVHWLLAQEPRESGLADRPTRATA